MTTDLLTTDWSSLSEWYYIYETSRAIINPNTYVKMTINNGIAVWVFTRGGYLLWAFAGAYPGVTAVAMTPLLISSSTRKVLQWSAGQTLKMTGRSFRAVRGWFGSKS